MIDMFSRQDVPRLSLQPESASTALPWELPLQRKEAGQESAVHWCLIGDSTNYAYLLQCGVSGWTEIGRRQTRSGRASGAGGGLDARELRRRQR